jgi:hypothetical protein
MFEDDEEDVRLENATASLASRLPESPRHIPHFLDPANASRPVDWRWQRGVLLADRKLTRRQRTGLDSFQARAVEFLKGLRACGECKLIKAAYERLAARMPAEYSAFFWWAERVSPLKYMLEAYLLGGLAPGDAAARCGLAPAAGEFYAAVYFDVQDRLHCPGFIVAAVIGAAATARVDPFDFATLWRLIGYTKGPVFLDAMCLRDSVRKHATNMAEVQQARRDTALDFFGVGAIRAALALEPRDGPSAIARAYSRLLSVPEGAWGPAAAGVPTDRPKVVSVMDVLRGATCPAAATVGPSPMPVPSELKP